MMRTINTNAAPIGAIDQILLALPEMMGWNSNPGDAILRLKIWPGKLSEHSRDRR